MNKILALLPQDIFLTEDLYIEGLLWKNPIYTPEYLVVQAETSLQNISNPYTNDNLAVMPAPNVTMDY